MIPEYLTLNSSHETVPIRQTSCAYFDVRRTGRVVNEADLSFAGRQSYEGYGHVQAAL